MNIAMAFLFTVSLLLQAILGPGFKVEPVHMRQVIFRRLFEQGATLHNDIESIGIKNVSLRFQAFLEKEKDIEITLIPEVQRLEFTPRSFSKGTASDIWEWWRSRKSSEAALKSAISSNISDIRSNFKDHEQYLALEKCDLLQANEDFFSAICNTSMKKMRTLWAQEGSTVCIIAGDSTVRCGYEGEAKYSVANVYNDLIRFAPFSMFVMQR